MCVKSHRCRVHVYPSTDRRKTTMQKQGTYPSAGGVSLACSDRMLGWSLHRHIILHTQKTTHWCWCQYGRGVRIMRKYRTHYKLLVMFTWPWDLPAHTDRAHKLVLGSTWPGDRHQVLSCCSVHTAVEYVCTH